MVQEEQLSFEQAQARIITNTVFTTHTPVPAGNDKFPHWQIDRHLNGYWDPLGLNREEFMARADDEGAFGMTPLALRMSSKANGVSELHGEVARDMWKWMYPNSDVPDRPHHQWRAYQDLAGAPHERVVRQVSRRGLGRAHR